MDSPSTPEATTPAPSQAIRRKRKRLQNFLDGRANAAYIFNPALRSSDVDELSPAHKKRELDCKHGCSIPLVSLSQSYKAISEHPAKTLRNRKASYRHPHNEPQYKNVTGKPTHYQHTINTLCIHVHTKILILSLAACSSKPMNSRESPGWIWQLFFLPAVHLLLSSM